MNWSFERISISKWVLFIIVMGAIIALTGWMAYSEDKSGFYPATFTGLCSGFVVLLVDKWIGRSEIQFLSRRDHIESVIEGRENEKYYGELIRSSKRQLDFFGRTGKRLLQDFADMDSQSTSKRLLLNALDRNVAVRFLVADPAKLDIPAAQDVELVKRLYGEIKLKYSGINFEIKYYNFEPAFSYFRADDKIIFGANFPGQKSRHTPSVIANVRSSVSKAYMQFFENTWDAAND